MTRTLKRLRTKEVMRDSYPSEITNERSNTRLCNGIQNVLQFYVIIMTLISLVIIQRSMLINQTKLILIETAKIH